MKRVICLLGFLLLFTTVNTVKAAERLSLASTRLYEETLDNGLTYIVDERPGTGVLSVNIRVDKGSADEGSLLGYGITHLIEHMTFKDALNYENGGVLKAVKSIGGSINATTSQDTTCFFITCPSEHIKRALDILINMVFSATFPPEELENEKKVILKEMLLNEDKPDRQLLRLLWKTAYRIHPYRHPIIGYPELFKSVKTDDVTRYYKKTFVPNNVTIAIVGDVKKDEISPLIKDIFQKIPEPDYETVTLPEEPPQINARYNTEKTYLELARIAFGFHSTSSLDNDVYAMDLLATILAQGDDSRLHRRLVKETELAHSVYAFNDTPRYKGLFVVTCVLDPKNIEQVKNIVLEELSSIKQDFPSHDEIERAKKIILSRFIYSNESTAYVAAALTANKQLTGDVNFQKKYMKKINSVDPGQITEVANRYFSDEKLNFVQLLPENVKTQMETDEVKPVIPGIDTSKKIELGNGIRLVLIKNSTTPSVYITAIFLGGFRTESYANNGISNITSRLLLKGTLSKNESQIKPAFERRGGLIDSFCLPDGFGITAQVLQDDFDFAFDTIGDILRNSIFPQDELDKVKRLVLTDIKLNGENIFAKGSEKLSESLYVNHPYAMSKLGSEKSVNSITRNDILHFYEKFCVPQNMVIAVCGDFTPEVLQTNLKKKYGVFNKVKNAVTINPKPVLPLASDEKSEIYMNKKEALILVGYLGVTFKDKDRFVLDVLASIMSGRSGRLFQNIRNYRSLSYTQNFFHNSGFDRGKFGIYVACSPENADGASEAIMSELEKLKKGGVTDEEVEQAKTELISQYRVSMQTNGFVSLRSAICELYGGGFQQIFDYEKTIKNVTKAAVDMFIDKYISQVKYALVKVVPDEHKKCSPAN
ncbi:MAG: insulinase family protein [Candidatus Omnitrophica bacterium]|nr:insulinase family protein [Candidatus Omnitrophota bacterium]